ncbi:MAG: alpha/beta fold hydrolase, partial [Candidatus Obscuribacterales bacterium]|nr:alpha/beta fold hydrolase [Steroidobacteraceae bacterium]
LVALSKLGYATYALDMRGYGSTPRNLNGWNTPNEAAEDVATTLKWINQRHPKLGKPVLFGWSMGSLVAHLTTQMHPELLSDLVLYGYPRDPASTSPAIPSPTEPPREVNTAKRAASDFISPQVTSQQLIETYVAAALQADPVRADWHHNDQYSQLNPAKITRPTLVLHGDRDPSTPQAAQSRLFVALGTVDKQWVILPGGDHAAMLEDTHDAFIAAIHAFVARPQVRNAQH